MPIKVEKIPNIKTDDSPFANQHLDNRVVTNQQLIEMNKNLALLLEQMTKLEAAVRAVAGAIGANAPLRK